MPSLLDRLKFTWGYFAKGRHRPEASALPDFDYPPPDPQLMGFLAAMYCGHGADVMMFGNWVCVDGGRLFTRAAHFNLSQPSQQLILQTDFVTLTEDGRHIVESFAGIGADMAAAVKDACKSFQDSSFHVLFTTLLDRACNHVEREVWSIGGQQRKVTFGWLRMRGKLSMEEWPPVFEGIQRQVETISLSPGLHWARYFYSRFPSESPTTEVLIDNETHYGLQMRMTELLWPDTDDIYTARLFFVVQDG